MHNLPRAVKEEDVDVYTREFDRTGFASALSWVRNIDRNWELLAPWMGANVEVPALYMAGEKDHVVRFPSMSDLIANLAFVPHLSRRSCYEAAATGPNRSGQMR